MTRIRATCPSCGEVDLRPHEIELNVVRSDVGQVGDGSNYAFDCPSCTEQVIKPADERIARLLATGGVPVSVDSFDGDFGELVDDLGAESLPHPGQPTEPEPGVPHPESPPAGAPLTYDDLLDFHLLLERSDWFDELVALTH